MTKYIKISLIETYIKNNSFTITKFCKLCNINPQTLKKIMQNKSNFNISSLFKIAKVMKLEIHELFY